MNRKVEKLFYIIGTPSAATAFTILIFNMFMVTAGDSLQGGNYSLVNIQLAFALSLELLIVSIFPRIRNFCFKKKKGMPLLDFLIRLIYFLGFPFLYAIIRDFISIYSWIEEYGVTTILLLNFAVLIRQANKTNEN